MILSDGEEQPGKNRERTGAEAPQKAIKDRKKVIILRKRMSEPPSERTKDCHGEGVSSTPPKLGTQSGAKKINKNVGKKRKQNPKTHIAKPTPAKKERPKEGKGEVSAVRLQQERSSEAFAGERGSPEETAAKT